MVSRPCIQSLVSFEGPGSMDFATKQGMNETLSPSEKQENIMDRVSKEF